MKKISLSEFLSQSRNNVGLTQHDVSQTLGYSTSQFVSNWERGVSQPPLGALKKLASMYKVPADTLFQVFVQQTVDQVQNQLHREFYGSKGKGKKKAS